MAISSAQKCLYQSGHAICCATVSPLDCCIDLLSGYKSHTYFLRIISFLQKSHRDLLSDYPLVFVEDTIYHWKIRVF